ncbi:DEAD/DEAH box helicase [Patescibacteria group bacterium]|nr:DEAD/DEAH box helicase [Patescibacteria group bacterium]
MNTEIPSFNGLGIAPKLMEIIDKLGFKSPTPIQKQSIPAAISGKDLIGIAQTGTGKTLAFGIPMLQRLAITKAKGLVLVPTRELAVQVNESLKVLGRSLGLKTAVIIGGESMFRQLSALKQDPHIIIATPGRLIDILSEKRVNLSKVGVLVLDEADRMLDMGFAPQLKKIVPHLPKARQTMLFSATMDDAITGIASSFLQLPVRIEVAPAGTTADQVTQEIYIVNKDGKTELLKKILQEYKGSTLIFCRTKYGAKKIAEVVRRTGHTSSEIHSNRSLNQRLEALQGFKIGKYRVLVATDIAARGIDVTNIELVINYDLPEQASDYVHRIGRTARAGKAGHAISFATTDQQSDIRAIERLIKQTLKVKKFSGSGAASANAGSMQTFTPRGGQRGMENAVIERSFRPAFKPRGRGNSRGASGGAGRKPFNRFRPKPFKGRHRPPADRAFTF